MDGFNRLATAFRQNDSPRAGKLTALANATGRFLDAMKREHGPAGDHYEKRFECGILVAVKPGGDTGLPFHVEYAHGLRFVSSLIDEVRMRPPADALEWFPSGLVGCDDRGRIVQFYRQGEFLTVRTDPFAIRVECVSFGVRNAE